MEMPNQQDAAERQAMSGGEARSKPDGAPAQSQRKGDAPERILQAWIAMEVLSPPRFDKPEDLAGGDTKRIAWWRHGRLPWEAGERSKKDYKLFYQVPLGAVLLEPAMQALLEKYGDSRAEPPRVRGKALIGALLVDQRGIPSADNPVTVASFPWGLMRSLKDQISSLAGWLEAEARLTDAMGGVLQQAISRRRGKQDVEQTPVDLEILEEVRAALARELELPAEWVEQPEFAVRTYVYYKDPNPPEALLLNCFFLEDLILARRLIQAGEAPQVLRCYLGTRGPEEQEDLLRRSACLRRAVSPGLAPKGAWPHPGGASPVLLQQAALNLALEETAQGRIVGINGPPGTGKTTLLRDLIAAIVTERAIRMAELDDPETAFSRSGIKSGAAWRHLYSVDPRLRGFEIVVSSSNNKAVENISSEIPAARAVSEGMSKYFKTLSDCLHRQDTWGAIAAVLGKAQNRANFSQTFWWKDDCSLNSYLRAVLGMPVSVEERSADGQTFQRPPRIIQEEHPPSIEEAKHRWKQARADFLDALREAESLRAGLLKAEEALDALEQLPAQVEQAIRDVSQAQDRLAAAKKEAEQTESAVPAAQRDLDELRREREELQRRRPGWLQRLFRTAAARGWSARSQELEKRTTESEARLEEAERLRRLRKKAVEEAAKGMESARRHHLEKSASLQTAERKIESAKQGGVVFADDAFFRLDHAERQLLSVWAPARLRKAQLKVFAEAMKLHRAFIDAAARPIRHNLGILMTDFPGRRLAAGPNRRLLGDLWATLFLVIPVVSTTFASVYRMLGALAPGELGWLLMDEAGQAVPQAAVGAMMRCRRIVAVGDPAQLEPVVELPDQLTSAICREFGIDSGRWAAPSASVQTLADAAGRYGCEFETRTGSRRTGIPLLVHRRCSEPMFSICNAIAYSGLMVSAKQPRQSALAELLGPSRWIHVEGSGTDKWCEAEGEHALRLLQKIVRSGENPDLYLLSPFVVAADNLRRLILDSGILEGVVEKPSRWVYERIGTVHTAQGREADVVILVLGAPMDGQEGARRWAGSRPNLLNVAVSRAREALYVIGNRRLWKEAGFFDELARRLTERRE